MVSGIGKKSESTLCIKLEYIKYKIRTRDFCTSKEIDIPMPSEKRIYYHFHLEINNISIID